MRGGAGFFEDDWIFWRTIGFFVRRSGLLRRVAGEVGGSGEVELSVECKGDYSIEGVFFLHTHRGGKKFVSLSLSTIVYSSRAK